MNPQKQMVMSVVSKPMLKHKWAKKKNGLRESVITCKMKLREEKGARRDSFTHIKNAASHQMEVVTDATTSLGKGFKKSITSYKKEASRFARNLGELVDVEDILKSIHQVAHPEEHAKRKTSIIHTPIEWKNHTKPASKTFLETCPTIFENEEEEEKEDGESGNERDGSDEPVQIFQKVDPAQNGKDEIKKEQILPIIAVLSNESQTNLEKQRGMSRSRKFSTSAPFRRNIFEEEEIIASSRRLSMSSLSLVENDLSKHRILGSSQIQDEDPLSTSIPFNESQLGQMKNSEKPLLTSPNKSYLSSDVRRRSCHNGPSEQQIHSLTNRQRRSSCYLNVKSADTISAFRCKSPITRRKLSNVNLDGSTVGNMINECA